MYIYFLPLTGSSDPSSATSDDEEASSPDLPAVSGEVVIPTPTHDGGLEHTAARFLHADTWLKMAQSSEIIMFPPQFFLLHLINPFLKAPTANGEPFSREELKAQRKALQSFVTEGDPPWGEKVISPIQFMQSKKSGRSILGLDKPGLELKDSGRRGEAERVVLVNFGKDGPRNVEVRWRKEVLEEERAHEKL